MKPVRTTGIVSDGGDQPGLNPVLRAIVRSAIYEHGMRVIGMRNGFDGRIWPEGAKEMTEESVSVILPRGVTVLGHVQGGGSPAPFDRILGTRFAVAAADLLAKEQFGRMICLKAGKMESVSLDEALETMKYIDLASEIVHAARAVGATFGDGA
jgi:6-phosphofructokinase